LILAEKERGTKGAFDRETVTGFKAPSGCLVDTGSSLPRLQPEVLAQVDGTDF
jgi:hypothetical protein